MSLLGTLACCITLEQITFGHREQIETCPKQKKQKKPKRQSHYPSSLESSSGVPGPRPNAVTAWHPGESERDSLRNVLTQRLQFD